MGYNIFKINQKQITDDVFTNEQSIIGNKDGELPFCVVNAKDDLTPGEDFEIDVDLNIERLKTETGLYTFRELAHNKVERSGLGTITQLIWVHTPFYVTGKTINQGFIRYQCIKASKSFVVIEEGNVKRKGLLL